MHIQQKETDNMINLGLYAALITHGQSRAV